MSYFLNKKYSFAKYQGLLPIGVNLITRFECVACFG